MINDLITLPKFLTACYIGVAIWFAGFVPAFAGGEVDGILNQADDLIKRGNVNQALELLERGVKKHPRDAFLWVKYAHAQEIRGRYKDALDSMKNARFFAPNDREIVNELIRIKLAAGDVIESPPAPGAEGFTQPFSWDEKKMFQDALKLREKGELDSAFRAFVECVNKNSRFLQGHDKGFVALGLEYFGRKADLNDPEGLFYFSLFREFAGDSDSAESGFQRLASITSDPDLVGKALERLDRLRWFKEGQAAMQNPTVVSSSVVELASGSLGSAAITIIEGGTEEEKMAGLLKSGIPEMQMRAIKWVGKKKVKSELIVKSLGECLNSGESEVVLKALDVMGQMGSAVELVLNLLEERLRDDRKQIRLETFRLFGLAKPAPSQMIPQLIALLDEGDAEIANGAVRALAGYGEDAIPLLQEASEKGDQRVKERVSMAVYLIRKNQ